MDLWRGDAMRVVNALLSLLLGLALVAGGILVAVEAVATAVGAGPFAIPVTSWASLLEHRQLHDPWAIAGFAAATGVGALLLLTELRPWRPLRLAIGVDGPTSWWLSRRSVEEQVQRATLAAAPAWHAAASVRPRHRRWEVRLRAVARTDARPAIAQAAEAGLARLGAPQESRVRLRIRPPRHRARVA
jgi:hypothetical protein